MTKTKMAASIAWAPKIRNRLLPAQESFLLISKLSYAFSLLEMHMRTPRAWSFFSLAVAALFVGIGYCIANPLDDAKKTLTQAQNNLAHQRDNLANATKRLKDAEAVTLARKHDVDNAIKAVTSSQNLWDSRHSTLVAKQQISAGLANLSKQYKTGLDTAQANENKVVNALLSTNITLVNFDWRLNAELDLKSQGFNTWAEFPLGMKLTSGEIASVFKGAPTLPDVNPLELLTVCLGMTINKECDFDDYVKKAYTKLAPTDRVYVSTRGLAELLSPEHLASATIDAVFTGGTTIEGSTQELANGCLRELNAVYAFLQSTAKDDADNLLPNIAETIMTGKEFKSPTVQIKPFTANMKYTVKLAGASELLRYLPQIKQPNTKVGMTFSTARPGFVVVVKNVAPKLSRDDLVSTIGKSKAPGAAVLKKVLTADVFPFFQMALGENVDPSTLVAAELTKTFQQIDYSNLNVDDSLPILLDLRDTPVGARLNTLASKLKFGNGGDAKVTHLTVNIHSGQVKVGVDLRAKHDILLGDAIKLVGKKMEELDAGVLKEVHAAAAEIGKAQKELSETLAKLGAANSVANQAFHDLDVAKKQLDDAVNHRSHVKDLLNEAHKAQVVAQANVNAAQHSVAQAQATVNHALDVLQHLHLPPAPKVPHLPNWHH